MGQGRGEIGARRMGRLGPGRDELATPHRQYPNPDPVLQCRSMQTRSSKIAVIDSRRSSCTAKAYGLRIVSLPRRPLQLPLHPFLVPLHQLRGGGGGKCKSGLSISK